MQRKVIYFISLLLLLVSFVYAQTSVNIPKIISPEEALKATDSQFKSLQEQFPGCSITRSILNFPKEGDFYYLIEIAVGKYQLTSSGIYEEKKIFSRYFYIHPYTGKVYTDLVSLEKSWWGSNITEADATQLEVELEKVIPIEFRNVKDYYPIAWSSNGKKVILCSWEDVRFYLIDIEKGKLIEIFNLPFSQLELGNMVYLKGNPGSVCFSPDDKKIVFSWANEVWRIDIENKEAKILYRFNLNSYIESLFYSCDGKKLIVILEKDEKYVGRVEREVGVLDIRSKKVSFYKGEEAKKLIQISCNNKAIFGNKIITTKYIGGLLHMYVKNIFPPHHATRLFVFKEKLKPYSVFWSPSGEKIKFLAIKKGKLYLYVFSVKFRKN